MEKEKRLKINEAVIVEGKYDKMKLASVLDAMIIVLDGFGIYKNREKLMLIRSLAKARGLVVLTDSDFAGFRLRHYLGSAIPPEQIKHVYIPDIAGKERRKAHPGKEGVLGVEGMSTEVLLAAFEHAGIGCAAGMEIAERVTKLDLYEMGLSGGKDSAILRRELCRRLGLPARLSANALAEVLTALVSREELRNTLSELKI